MSDLYFEKDPLATLDYTVDWSDWLDAGDTIDTSTWTIDAGITSSLESNTTTTATVWLSGGVSGTSYNVVNIITTTLGRIQPRTLTIFVRTQNNLSSLIPLLRMKIGDLNYLAYRYTDEWLITSLIMSISILGRWWNYKYLLDNSKNIYRNPNTTFLFPNPPILEPGDDIIIVLMAAIIILEGSLENSAWDAVSWRDNEISFSNLESYRTRGRITSVLWEELKSLITPPTRKLATGKKNSLPGYKNNLYEYKGDF